MIPFYQDETSTLQPGRISPYNYMKKPIFITVKRDRFPPGICLQNLLDSHLFKNVHKIMKFCKDICLLFSHKWRHMHPKNRIEITTIYWNVLFFQTNVLINFFISLRRDEATTWESFVSANRDPGSTNKGSRLARMKLFTCSHNMYLTKNL